jgi:hypothetical protein
MDNPIVIGCNYHTKWQSKPGMRFVLYEVREDRARLVTRNTNKDFWTYLCDLIFINSDYNINKAIKMIKKDSESFIVKEKVNA